MAAEYCDAKGLLTCGSSIAAAYLRRCSFATVNVIFIISSKPGRVSELRLTDLIPLSIEVL